MIRMWKSGSTKRNGATRAAMAGVMLGVACAASSAEAAVLTGIDTNAQFIGGSFLQDTRMGVNFTPDRPIRVVALAVRDLGVTPDGLALPVPTALYHVSAPGGAQQLARGTIPAGTAAPLSGFFRLQPLATPIELVPGERYQVNTLHRTGGEGTGVTPSFTIGEGLTNVNFSADQSAFGLPDFAFTFSIRPASPFVSFGPSFLYEIVPEPASLGLLGAVGVLSLRRRPSGSPAR